MSAVNVIKESVPDWNAGNGTALATGVAKALFMPYPLRKRVTIHATAGNTASIFIGPTLGNAINGFEIKAGETTPPILIDDLSKVFVAAPHADLAGNYDYSYTFVTATGETAASPASAVVSPSGQHVTVTIAAGPTGTTARKIYRTDANGAPGTEKLLTTINNNTTLTYDDIVPDGSLTTAAPTVDTTTLAPPAAPTVAVGAAGNLTGMYLYRYTFVTAAGETSGGADSVALGLAAQQGALSNIAAGPTGTTARKIYRTVAGGAAGTEELAGTLADNTTLTFADNLADTGLGAAVPTTNTSGVASPSAPTAAVTGVAVIQSYSWLAA